jgi:hypothetical protein
MPPSSLDRTKEHLDTTLAITVSPLIIKPKNLAKNQRRSPEQNKTP